MKHLAIIQSEFVKSASSKVATNWDELPYEGQKEYLRQHPASKRKITAKPEKKLQRNY